MSSANASASAVVELAKTADRWSRRHAAVVGLLACLVVGFRSWTPAWSIDEAASVMVVRRSAAHVWQSALVDAALGPYYLFLFAWSHVSDSGFSLRLPSAICAGLAVVVVFALVTEASSRRTAFYTVAGLILIPSVSRFGQDARPYAFDLLAVSMAVLFWWRSVHRGGVGYGVGLSASLVAAGLAHAYSLLIIPVLVLAALAFPREEIRRAVRRTLVPTVLALGALAPFLVVVLRNASGSPDPPAITVINVGRTLVEVVVSSSRPATSPGVTLSALALAISCLTFWVAGIVVTWREGGESRVVAVLVASWFLLPPTALIALQIATGKPGMISRYWFAEVPALAWGIGITLASLSRRNARTPVVMVVLLGLLALPSQMFIRTDDGHSGLAWQKLGAVLNQPSVAGIPLVTNGANYRGLIANQPDLPPSRLPLVMDPKTAGLINPKLWGLGSAPFAALVADHSTVIIYVYRHRELTSPPSAASFGASGGALAVWSRSVLTCAYFGDALGIFIQPGAKEPANATLMRKEIEAIAPAYIQCRV